MTLNEAFSVRLRGILKTRHISLSAVGRAAQISRSTLNGTMNGRVKASNFKLMAKIIRELGMTIAEFFDDPVFEWENLDID